jgi:hypothetical protein
MALTAAPGRELARSTWRRGRFWLALAVVVAIGAVLITALTEPSGRPLDPTSPSKPGSLALTRLLATRGVVVHRVTSLSDLHSPTALISFPDSYSSAQLADLARSGTRLVLVDPDQSALSAATGATLSLGTSTPDESPGCDEPGAVEAGPVTVFDSAQTFAAGPGWTGTFCYGGAVAVAPTLVAFGSGDLLTNADLDDAGVAALAINTISDDGRMTDIDWLMPGPDARGEGSPSVWRVLPDWTPRAVVVLLLLGLIVALWKGRRLGPVVIEPLPVVVRSAELVEGHGRLYERAHARAETAAALREGARVRLAARLGLRSAASGAEVADAASRLLGRAFPPIAQLLAPAVPPDDVALMNLAQSLDELVRAASTVHLSPNKETS